MPYLSSDIAEDDSLRVETPFGGVFVDVLLAVERESQQPEDASRYLNSYSFDYLNYSGTGLRENEALHFLFILSSR